MKAADQNDVPQPVDLVNRFTSTPIQGTFKLSGKVISFATNCPELLSRIATLAPEFVEDNAGQQLDCVWRIVTEPETGEALEPCALSIRHVGNDSLSFFTIGRHSFLAYDERTRRGISFISESLIRNQTLFVETLLPSFLLLLSAGKRQ